MDMYMKNDLFKEMKNRGLSISYSSLLRYERDGIIQRPESTWRLYTKQQVEDIIGAIVSHRDAHPQFGKEYMKTK